MKRKKLSRLSFLVKKNIDAYLTQHFEGKKKRIDLFLVILGILISFFGIAVPMAFFFLTWNIYDNYEKSHGEMTEIQNKMNQKWEQFNEKNNDFEKQYDKILLALQNAKNQEAILRNLVIEAQKTKDDLAKQSNDAQKFIVDEKGQIEKLAKKVNEITVETLTLQLINQAENDLTNKLYENAISEYETLIEASSQSHPICYGNLGFAYFQKSDYNNAIKYFEKAIELSPDEPGLYISKSLAESEINENDKALTTVDKAIEIINNEKKSSNNNLGSQSSDPLHNRVGILHLVTKSTLSNCYIIKGRIYEMNKKFDLAKENYMAAVEDQKTNSRALWQYGRFLSTQKLYSQAEQYLQHAATLDGSPEVLLNLAEVQIKLGKDALALQTLDKIIGSSKLPRAYGLRAEIKFRLQDQNGAYEDLIAFSELSDSSDDFFTKTKIEISLKKYSEALNSINRAITLNKQSSELYIYKIALLLLQDKYDSELIDYCFLRLKEIPPTPKSEHYAKVFNMINNQLKIHMSIDWDDVFTQNANRNENDDWTLNTCLISILKKYPVDSLFPLWDIIWYNTLFIREK